MTASSVDIALFAAKVGLVFFVILTLAAYLVFAERRILAWVQDRKGPNRVGPFGLLQPLADLIKLLTKEDLLPAAADKWLFYLAPAMAAIPAIMIFAVIPFGAPMQVAGHTVPLVVSDLNIGLLFFLALSSIAVYGVAIGGWERYVVSECQAPPKFVRSDSSFTTSKMNGNPSIPVTNG